MIQIDFESRLAEALRGQLSPDEVAKAISAGLNRAAAGIRAQIVRDLKEEVNLKPAYLRSILPIERSTADSLMAVIVVRRRKIPLIEYVINLSQLRSKARVPRDGKSVLVAPQARYTKDGAVTTFEHAFLITNAGRGGTGGVIVERKGRARRPMRAVYGPPLQVHGSRIIQAAGQEMQERVRKEITAAIRGQIARALPK